MVTEAEAKKLKIPVLQTPKLKLAQAAPLLDLSEDSKAPKEEKKAMPRRSAAVGQAPKK